MLAFWRLLIPLHFAMPTTAGSTLIELGEATGMFALGAGTGVEVKDGP